MLFHGNYPQDKPSQAFTSMSSWVIHVSPFGFPGGLYGSNCFSPSRNFTISDPVWRRRWWRRRVPRQQQTSQPCTPSLETAATKPPTTEQEESTGKSVIYQPALSVLHNGSAGLDALGGVGKSGRSSRAGLCVRVDGSTWSRPLNIAVQGAGGPFQVMGTFFLSSGVLQT